MSVFAVEADCKRKNGHGRRRARQYGRITKPRQAAGLLGFVAEGYTVSVQPFYICTNLTLPTGNLDSVTAGEIINILKTLAKDRDKCVIVVTHSKEVADSADIILELSGKKLKKVNKMNLEVE